MKYEFQRRDIYAFSFANHQELKFFIESVGIVNLPEDFVKCMFDAIISPKSNKINYLLLKQFIDICQDSHLVQEQGRPREIKGVLQNVGLEDPPIRSHAKPK